MARILGGKHKIFKHIDQILEEHNVEYHLADIDLTDMIVKPSTHFDSEAYVHIHDIKGNEHVFKILNVDEDNTFEKYVSVHRTMEMGYFFRHSANTYALLLDGEDMTLKINGEIVAGAYIEIKKN